MEVRAVVMSNFDATIGECDSVARHKLWEMTRGRNQKHWAESLPESDLGMLGVSLAGESLTQFDPFSTREGRRGAV